MPSQTNEAAMEATIESWLINDGNYKQGISSNYNKKYCVDDKFLFQFLEETQTSEISKINHKSDWKERLLDRLSKKIKKDGVVQILKKGLKIDDATFTLLNRMPYNDLNPELSENYDENIFSVTRQVYFSQDTEQSVDLVIFINGLPLITIELKNQFTGQSTNNAIKQYMKDRSPTEPLFEFGRCMVHFAVDQDEIYMTTRLNNEKTYFLPFNKGFNSGKGNPLNPLGFKTAYLWQEILEKLSLSNIVEHFAKIVEEKDPKTRRITKTLYFPRYHQLDVVRKILSHAKANGSGNSYLVQHSAGSGKSNSITWLSYQLVELYDSTGRTNQFDSVIVVTDRRILDKQIRDNIKSFGEVGNLVAAIDQGSQQLKKALEEGKKIIITTIFKFPFVVDEIQSLKDKKFAVIIDEAHSSQGGQTAAKLNQTLSGSDNPEGEGSPQSTEDKILESLKGRKMSKNASFFAFTATPKNSTLEKFGVKHQDGTFHAFHLYSMKQAIEEGFILDVLQNYTTYKSYYHISKSIEDNPLFDSKRAQGKLRAYVEGQKETIEAKTQVMVDHFTEKVWRARKLKGKAKAMVVTKSIISAITYYFAIKEYLKKKGAPYQAIIAFSGTKEYKGSEYTEDSLNGFPSKDIPSKLKTDDYKFLVVAQKFQTGFDEPLLHTMYVDKKLQFVEAVQTLSRLNRCNEKQGKSDTFVLDFYNSVDDIRTAFEPFYTSTALSEETDANVLNDLEEKIEEFGIIDSGSIDEFNQKFFNNAPSEQLAPIIDQVILKFDDELEDEQQIDCKIKCKHFVKLYPQIASIINFSEDKMMVWEKLFWFLKFLIQKMKVKNPSDSELQDLLESVDLDSYGLERGHLTNIDLDANETELDPSNANPRGFRDKAPDLDPLEEIINQFNETFFAGWDATEEEKRVKLVKIAQQVQEDPKYATQVLESVDDQNRSIALAQLIQDKINESRRVELDLYRKYAGDDDFRNAMNRCVSKIIENPEAMNIAST